MATDTKFVATWQSRIQHGLRERKRYGREEVWQRIRHYYEHRFQNLLEPNFNLIYMLANSLVPTLVFQQPSIVNTARRPEFQYWAQFFDGIDNWLVDEMELQDVFGDAVLNAFLYNACGIQLGYDFPEDGEQGSHLTFNPIKGCVDRTRKTNQPWLDLILPDRLVLAPGTKTIRNCPWFAKVVSLPTDLLKQRKGYKNIEPTHVPSETKDGEQKGEVPSEEYTSFYEVHDAETGKFFCMDTEGRVIRSPEEDPLQVDGLPLTVLTFNRTTGSVWGPPDAMYVETQLLEGNECRRDGRMQRRAALVKAFYKNGVLTKEDIDKFLNGDPMTMIGVEVPPEQPIGDVIQLTQPHVQIEYLEYQKNLLNDAQLLLGFGPNQMGTFSPGRRTKFEAQLVEDRSLLRTTIRRQRVSDAIAQMMGQVNQMIVRNWKAPVVAKVLGVEGALYWVKAKPSEFEELSAQLVTKVNIDSITPVSRERRKEEMMEVINLLTKMPGADIIPIIRSFLQSFDWVDVSKVLPMAQQGQEMGMQDFAAQQQGMMQNPNLPAMMQQNLGGMGRVINNLPPGGTANGPNPRPNNG